MTEKGKELVCSRSEGERQVESETYQEKKFKSENLNKDAKDLADFFLEYDDKRIRAVQFKEKLEDIFVVGACN